MLALKQKEFNEAMLKFHSNKYYQLTYKVVSIINVSLELVLLYILFTLSVPYLWIVPIVFISYFIADFINGLVHLYMDNNDSYNSFYGPFVSSFHLHHNTQRYKDKNIFLVYFDESGTKFWLIPYLTMVLIVSFTEINHIVLSGMILVGILSSVAEVSHYLCHNSKSKFVKLLQSIGLLLSMKHHEKHHNDDNTGYAFLNGMSDKLIDRIAKKFYKGYKYNSDKHYEKYEGAGTLNRD
ncbi:MAG: hypothetical protein H8E76_08425 [Helicobacteraceae bacterium]|nr:hypothetical protein [Candidatus Sulfurimonas ponti]MBL6973816.1 hypothetical protein [Sulfurimonas sp.]